MKKNLLVIALITMIVAIAGILFIGCASNGSSVDPQEKETAVALFNEVKALRDAFLQDGVPAILKSNAAWKTKEDVLTNDPYGRAESIYFLAEQYIQAEEYGKATQDALGQCKTYYSSFPPNKK